MYRKSLKILFSALAMLLVQVLCAALPLAKNGAPAAGIVLPTNADPTLKMAAEELQLWIKTISGAKLEIVNEEKDSAQIVLDPTASRFPADLKQLTGNDGYSVRQKGNKVYLYKTIIYYE